MEDLRAAILEHSRPGIPDLQTFGAIMYVTPRPTELVSTRVLMQKKSAYRASLGHGS